MFGLLKRGVKKIKQAKAAVDFKNQYVDRVNAELDHIAETKKISVEASAPFKMKKNEKYIASVGAVMGTYKRDGNFRYGAMTGRIKIAKGIYFRLGQGRIGMSKSWVYDQPGTIHFTSERLIFDGVNQNTTLKWDKVMNIQVEKDGSTMYVDKMSGADLSFKLDEIMPEKDMATAIAFQKDMIALSE
jgi:hypothetical protein